MMEAFAGCSLRSFCAVFNALLKEHGKDKIADCNSINRMIPLVRELDEIVAGMKDVPLKKEDDDDADLD